MADWKSTQYRNAPPPDHLAEGEDWKFGVGGLLLVLVLLGSVAVLVYSLFTLFQ